MDNFSAILGTISGEPTTDRGLGHPMGLAHVHHFLIAIMKKHFHAMVDKYGFTDELFNEQSGHSEEVGMLYCSAGCSKCPELP